MNTDRAATVQATSLSREGVIPETAAALSVLSVRHLTKRFTDVVAIRDLDIDFHGHEIHAVLGENGAGKSTLVKMLYGFYQPTAGDIYLHGERVTFHSPADARRCGIGMVFQNFSLVPALTVWENVALVTPGPVLLNAHSIMARIEALSERYGLGVRPDARVRDLSIGEQQRVEILKALATGPSILILDEPTSVLAPHEVASLLEVVRRLRDDGFAVILITHKLAEVFSCADRVTTLRRGEATGTGRIADLDQHALLTLMLGERAADEKDPVSTETTASEVEGLALRNLTFRSDDGRTPLRDVDLDVQIGEMVGIAAVSGNGQAHLGDAFLGTGAVLRGSVHIGGADVTASSPAARLASGLAIVPEDPLRDGSVPEMSIAENLSIAAGPGSPRGFLMQPGEVTSRALEATRGAPFPVPPLKRQLGTLSGGNIQRIVLARELNADCRYLVAYYPTRGLDLTSTRAVRQRLIDLKSSGRAVLLISEDLDELRALCDRIFVLHDGEVVGCFPQAEADPMEIGRLMTGGAH